MNAWLITWATEPPEVIVAVLSSRKSPETVATFMEVFYESARYGLADCMVFANRRSTMPHRAQTPLRIHGYAHRDRVLCGNGPWLYARKVRELTVTADTASNEEVVSWLEPDELTHPSNMPAAPIVVVAGTRKSLRRPNQPLLHTRIRAMPR